VNKANVPDAVQVGVKQTEYIATLKGVGVTLSTSVNGVSIPEKCW
jgi:hypothetical protein